MKKNFITLFFFIGIIFASNSNADTITFTISDQTLVAFGKTYKATSGANGNKVIKEGTYKMPSKGLMHGNKGKKLGVPYHKNYDKAPFADKKQFKWFAFIKGDLGIHPDGGAPGTNGCIGIKETDTKTLFEEFKKRYNEEIILKVKN